MPSSKITLYDGAPRPKKNRPKIINKPQLNAQIPNKTLAQNPQFYTI